MGGSDPDERWKDWVEKTFDEHEKRLSGTETFQKWQMGGAAVLMWVLGFLSDKIKHLIG